MGLLDKLIDDKEEFELLKDAEKFWSFARKTSFYEEILQKDLYNSFKKNFGFNFQKKFYNNIFELIFSVKYHKVDGTKYKVLTLFGIRFKRKVRKM